MVIYLKAMGDVALLGAYLAGRLIGAAYAGFEEAVCK